MFVKVCFLVNVVIKVNKMKKILVVFIFMAVLGACSLTKEDLGMARSKPDETKVEPKRKALFLPPDYDVLP